ncbi:GbsR/MarR family transcriptional regulator [Yinghuangia seranimata]|uniref:GbsR/MarR family transcriptional regulator n=1 Tax=Yinghuangia seranimata TaxID=408067 RepID=UPI00248CBEE1|nr:MarR family transcriptional regulator [Yinghuangia seranimata]MDI2125639.1 MarR family transcriptional regulator [Yinghuangia seranimata]
MTTPEDQVAAFVERFAAELAEAGMSRMPARVFAALLASDDGVLGSADLADRLQISPAAVSGAVRYLSQVGMLAREREPGSRRERYRVRSDQWFRTFASRDRMLVRWEETLRTGVAAVGPDTAAGERLAETVEFFEFLQEELSGMMDRWRARQQSKAPAPEAG